MRTALAALHTWNHAVRSCQLTLIRFTRYTHVQVARFALCCLPLGLGVDTAHFLQTYAYFCFYRFNSHIFRDHWIRRLSINNAGRNDDLMEQARLLDLTLKQRLMSFLRYTEQHEYLIWTRAACLIRYIFLDAHIHVARFALCCLPLGLGVDSAHFLQTYAYFVSMNFNSHIFRDHWIRRLSINNADRNDDLMEQARLLDLTLKQRLMSFLRYTEQHEYLIWKRAACLIRYSGMLKSCLNLEIIVNSWGALDLKSRAFLVKRIGIAMFCWIWSLE